MKQDRPLVFFDVGGNYFNAQSEPCIEGLDGNKFLVEILDAFKGFLDDRITIENLILKLGTRLYESGFFIPLHYKLVYPSNEQEILIGSYAKRYKQANELKCKFGIQLRVSLEDTEAVTVYTVNSGEHRKVSREFAEELAEVINAMLDPLSDCEYIDTINVAEYSVHDDELESRDFANGIKDAEFPVIGICFHLSPEGKLWRYLDTTEGMDVICRIFSLFFDEIAGYI